ncbi:hypothetical protein FSP39_025195 [Pinctada imbricata]|uniref:Uncharacterized protein n=1 Tax=Pinctada imbricata TaxID=66713 RepID=A0AA88XYG3_PINIB|nr:hypothetical protein FSP39_025195 [Pinctada imbricata]
MPQKESPVIDRRGRSPNVGEKIRNSQIKDKEVRRKLFGGTKSRSSIRPESRRRDNYRRKIKMEGNFIRFLGPDNSPSHAQYNDIYWFQNGRPQNEDINTSENAQWKYLAFDHHSNESNVCMEVPLSPGKTDPSSWVYMATEVPSEEFWTERLQFDSDEDESDDDEDIDDILSKIDSDTLISIFQEQIKAVSETSLSLSERYPSFYVAEQKPHRTSALETTHDIYNRNTHGNYNRNHTWQLQ